MGRDDKDVPSDSSHDDRDASGDERDRKRRKSGKGREKKAKRSGSGSAEVGAVNAIGEDDFYAKSAEFIVWLREARGGLSLSEIRSSEARRLFAKFVKKWNRGSLASKFYAGIAATDIASNERSKHQWKFKVNAAEEAKLIEAKDSVHVMTASASGLQDVRRPHRASAAGPMPAPAPSSHRERDAKFKVEEEMDDEDRERYLRGMRKKEEKSFQTRRNADLEDLAPKATGREAQLEKRRAVNAYHKQERDLDVNLKDSDLMGGGDSFAAHLERERRRKERAEERRQQSSGTSRRDGVAGGMDVRLQSYKAKEDATMAMLRDLAAKNHGIGGSK